MSHEQIKEEISGRFRCNTDSITVFDLFTQFGGGKSSGFCLIYDTKDYKLKYEPKWRLRRESLIEPKNTARTRKTKKNIKIKTRNLKGKAKVKVMNA